MEHVYVIRVKTKRPVSSLYPSERRYSASTVGGLSFVHFGLGALSLLLGTLALSLQGPILAVACLVPFVTGLLAWRRWYIDRNIGIFFYGSLFSLVAAILCFVATVLDIAATTENPETLWSLEQMLKPVLQHQQNQQQHIQNGTISWPGSTEEPYLDGVSTELRERNSTSDSLDERIESRVVSIWQKNYRASSQTRLVLTVNVLVAALLEVFWSVLSARIALRGMTNRPPGASCRGINRRTVPGQEPEPGPEPELQLEPGRGTKRKPPAPRADILDHDRTISGVLQTLNPHQTVGNPGPRLPMPESRREFRERVERFLANQAAHRIVEGTTGS